MNEAEVIRSAACDSGSAGERVRVMRFRSPLPLKPFTPKLRSEGQWRVVFTELQCMLRCTGDMSKSFSCYSNIALVWMFGTWMVRLSFMWRYPMLCSNCPTTRIWQLCGFYWIMVLTARQWMHLAACGCGAVSQLRGAPWRKKQSLQDTTA